MSLQPEAHAGPYPRDAQHRLFLCGNEREAHEYAKLPPHLVYRYLPRRDVLLLDLRLLAEDPEALPRHKRQLAERLCAWLESSAAAIDSGSCSGAMKEAEDRASRRTGEGNAGTAAASDGGDGEDKDEGSDDEALLLPRVRAFLHALRYPSVESPHTKEDAAVFAVLARCPMRMADVQAALAGRASHGFVGSDEVREGSGTAGGSASGADSAACSAEEGCSKLDAAAEAASASSRSSSGAGGARGSSGSGSGSGSGSPFIDSPPDDAAAHVLLGNDEADDGHSAGDKGSRSDIGGQPHRRSMRAEGDAEAVGGKQRHRDEAGHSVPWDGIVRRSRSEYLGRVVTEVLLPASAFRLSASKSEAAARVIRAQETQHQQRDESSDADALPGETASAEGTSASSSSAVGAAGTAARAASPPQEPGEAWTFPLTPAATSRSSAGSAASAAGDGSAAAAGGRAPSGGGAGDAAAAGAAPAQDKGGAAAAFPVVVTAPPALSLVEIVKVPPERGAATHVKRQHVPVHQHGHRGGSSAQPHAR